MVFDDTGEIEVTIFGDEGEKIMGMPATTILADYIQENSSTVDNINSKIKNSTLNIKVQSKIFNKQDGTSILSYTAQTLQWHDTLSALPSSSSSQQCCTNTSMQTNSPQSSKRTITPTNSACEAIEPKQNGVGTLQNSLPPDSEHDMLEKAKSKRRKRKLHLMRLPQKTPVSDGQSEDTEVHGTSPIISSLTKADTTQTKKSSRGRILKTKRLD